MVSFLFWLCLVPFFAVLFMPSRSLEGESVSRMQTRDLVNLFRWSKICILASSLPRLGICPPRCGKGQTNAKENIMGMKTSWVWKHGRANINEIYLFEWYKIHSIGSTNEKHCYSWNNKEEWSLPQLHRSLGGRGVIFAFVRINWCIKLQC